ncbi:hypothetical protein KY284_034438 [Solanum tuberosum]|nr:hypothetical protein KY284_034438 [Solanum tuberosum]
MKMAEFKSEKLLQLVGCEEGWFESSDKLISHGINVGDVKKFQEAGIYTCSGLMMHIKKREAVVGNTTGSESLDDVLGVPRIDYTVVKLHKPKWPCFKLNKDGSKMQNSPAGAAGVVIRKMHCAMQIRYEKVVIEKMARCYPN